MSDNIVPLDSDVCNVTFDKKEYAIVGDAVFAQSVVGVPDWMQELIGDLVDATNKDVYNAMTNTGANLLNALHSLSVAENQYTQAINSKITDQEAFVQAVETLNATAQDSISTTISTLANYATKEFAITTAATTLSSSINGGDIGSKLGYIAAAASNQYASIAQRMDVLESTFEDLNSDVEGYANATEKLETFVGKDSPDTNAPVIALSKFYRDLDAYLEGTGYSVRGSNTLRQYLKATEEKIISLFEYNSNITINGKTYNAGFGLVQTGQVADGNGYYDSEFWINANKLRFTSTNEASEGITPFRVAGTNVYAEDLIVSTARSVLHINDGGWALNKDGTSYFGNNSTFAGNLTIGTPGVANSTVIENKGVYVYDDKGKLRVVLGDLLYTPNR